MKKYWLMSRVMDKDSARPALRVWKLQCFFLCVYTWRVGPLRGQISSSCGELVVFGHQMGARRAPWLVKLKSGALCTPPSCSCEGLVAFGHIFGALFVYGIVYFLFYSSWDTQSKFSWKICEDATWFGWDIYDLKCLFVCRFVCLFINFFSFLF